MPSRLNDILHQLQLAGFDSETIEELNRLLKILRRNGWSGFVPADVSLDSLLQSLERQRDEQEVQLHAAQAGLRRALDYRAGTPEGLAIKADIREALIRSGDPGPWGVVGSPT